CADFALVQPQVQDGIIEFTRQRQGPKRRPGGMDRLWRLWRHVAWPLDQEGSRCQGTIERDGQVRVAQLVSLDRALQGGQGDPCGAPGPIRPAAKPPSPLLPPPVKA